MAEEEKGAKHACFPSQLLVTYRWRTSVSLVVSVVSSLAYSSALPWIFLGLRSHPRWFLGLVILHHSEFPNWMQCSEGGSPPCLCLKPPACWCHLIWGLRQCAWRTRRCTVPFLLWWDSGNRGWLLSFNESIFLKSYEVKGNWRISVILISVTFKTYRFEATFHICLAFVFELIFHAFNEYIYCFILHGDQVIWTCAFILFHSSEFQK